MATLTQPATSTQYVQQQVMAMKNGSVFDPSGDVVQMSFVSLPQYGPPPNPSSWNAATWEVDPGPVYWASILVGPANGGVVLAAGAYVIAVRVTDNPAVPVLWGAQLIISLSARMYERTPATGSVSALDSGPGAWPTV